MLYQLLLKTFQLFLKKSLFSFSFLYPSTCFCNQKLSLRYLEISLAYSILSLKNHFFYLLKLSSIGFFGPRLFVFFLRHYLFQMGKFFLKMTRLLHPHLVNRNLALDFFFLFNHLFHFVFLVTPHHKLSITKTTQSTLHTRIVADDNLGRVLPLASTANITGRFTAKGACSELQIRQVTKWTFYVLDFLRFLTFWEYWHL